MNNNQNEITQDDFKIDLVYLWVDDTDYFWKTKINKYRNDIEFFNKEAMNICRFYNNDEPFTIILNCTPK